MKLYFDPILGKLRRNDLKEAIAYFNSMGIYGMVTVANYSALPPPNTATGFIYICSSSQGTSWLPGPLGGTYYPEGFYYSTGSSWIYTKTAYQALQATVDAGLIDNQFVSPLTFNNASKWNQYALKQNGLVSGGTITIGTYGGVGVNNDIRVSPATWYISPNNYSSVSNTDFLDITLAATGLQRYVGFYGDNTNTITMVDGVESSYAAYPSTPVGKALIGYILVTDSGIATSPDLSGYMLIASKATSADVITGTDNTKYLTSSVIEGIVAKYQNISTTSSTSLTTNVANYRDTFHSITALAAAMTINAPTGTPLNGTKLWYRIKDNGTARALTWNAAFVNRGGVLPTTTTISKVLNVGLIYNTVTATWDCVAVTLEA